MRSLLHRLVLIATLFIPAVALADGWDDALERQIEQSIQQPRIQETPYNILNYGAKPSATAVQNQKAIQRAIDKCSKRGGGRVIVPAGQTFKTGAIEMKSGVRLMVEEGAVLEFVFQPELYPIVETSWEGLDCYNLSPCIYAFKAHDITLSGKGTIDGGGTRETWWPWCGATKYGWKEGIVSQKLGGRARLLQNGEDGEPMTDSKGRPTAARTFTAKDGMRPQLIGFNQCQRIL
ncbi:MAG: glycoside hydrolase, partial [Bacteroidaceae bacterium]|nr:glycoside hydrolase [Bacteroidaceae bacterium]